MAGVLTVRYAVLDPLPVKVLVIIQHPALDYLRRSVSEVHEEADHGQDEHAEDEDLAGPGLAGYELPGPVLGLGIDVTGGEGGALLLGVLDLSPVPVLVLLSLTHKHIYYPDQEWIKELEICRLYRNKSNLTAEDELEDPHDEHAGDAHDEGEDRGEEEPPPFPLLQTLFNGQAL